MDRDDYSLLLWVVIYILLIVAITGGIAWLVHEAG
jgi:hypothetical protein